MNKKKLASFLPLLEVLSNISADQRKIVINFLTDETHDILYECIKNGICNNTINEGDKQRLRTELESKKNNFRYILNNKGSKKKKKENLVQIGGNSLGIILEFVLPLITEYLLSVENKSSEQANENNQGLEEQK